jgi:hypothetical protein
MLHCESYVCYRQQIKQDWSSDDIVYRTRGERTGGVSHVSAIKLLGVWVWFTMRHNS